MSEPAFSILGHGSPFSYDFFFYEGGKLEARDNTSLYIGRWKLEQDSKLYIEWSHRKEVGFLCIDQNEADKEFMKVFFEQYAGYQLEEHLL